MSRIKSNIISNFAGNACNILLSLVFVPLYIELVGVEAYGLVGFFAMVQGVAACLDLGLSLTVNRELAVLSAAGDKWDEAADLVWTLEVLYWLMALCIGVVVYMLAPYIATRWVQSRYLDEAVVEGAVKLMGAVLLVQWPVSFYCGGLLGLQKHVVMNVVTVAASFMRSAGAFCVLVLISPQIIHFFAWQVVVSLGTVILLRVCFRNALPGGSGAARFRVDKLRSLWRFAAGTNVLSIQGAVMSNQDKLILSKVIALEQFGYYSFAAAAAQNLGRVSGPVVTTLFPRFAQLSAAADREGVARLFHRGCQLVAILCFPFMAVGSVFAGEIIMAWTNNPVLVRGAKDVFTLMVLGVGFNVVMHMPSALQVSHGWLSLIMVTNTVAIVLALPLMVAASVYYGGVGAALVYLVYNIIQLLVMPHFMHARLLCSEKWAWYCEDVCLPMAVAFAVALAVSGVVPACAGRSALVLWLLAALLVVGFSTLASTAEGRQLCRRAIMRLAAN